MKKIVLLIFTFFLILKPAFSQNTNFRKDIDILHYSISLNITDFQNKKISGNTVVKLSPREKNRENIKLELYKLNVKGTPSRSSCPNCRE